MQGTAQFVNDRLLPNSIFIIQSTQLYNIHVTLNIIYKLETLIGYSEIQYRSERSKYINRSFNRSVSKVKKNTEYTYNIDKNI